MRASELYELARRIREAALLATSDPNEPAPSYGELAIVEDVARNARTTVGDVAARTRLAQSLVSRIVARLRDGGILVTTRDPADRRRTLVSVDSHIRRDVLKPRGERAVGPALAAMLPHLEQTDLARLEAVLHEAYQLVSER